MAYKKINITLAPELLQRIDQYGQNNCISRSGLISLAVSQYLNAIEAQPNISKAFALMGTLAQKAVNLSAGAPVDQEQYNKELAELEEVQRKLANP